MYYVRTTGGSMMAVTPKSKTVIAVKKNPLTVKSVSAKNRQSVKKA